MAAGRGLAPGTKIRKKWGAESSSNPKIQKWAKASAAEGKIVRHFYF